MCEQVSVAPTGGTHNVNERNEKENVQEEAKSKQGVNIALCFYAWQIEFNFRRKKTQNAT